MNYPRVVRAIFTKCHKVEQQSSNYLQNCSFGGCAFSWGVERHLSHVIRTSAPVSTCNSSFVHRFREGATRPPPPIFQSTFTFTNWLRATTFKLTQLGNKSWTTLCFGVSPLSRLVRLGDGLFFRRGGGWCSRPANCSGGKEQGQVRLTTDGLCNRQFC